MRHSLLFAITYLERARHYLAAVPGRPPQPLAGPGPVFEAGAAWMGVHLARLRAWPLAASGSRPCFTCYGWLKYGLSLLGLALAALGLVRGSVWLWPVAALGFYVVEIQFLFLFPLLLERRPRPLLASCRLTARIGYGRCLLGVLPVAAYMLAGLVRPRHARLQWHVGCLAILLWYVDETSVA
ncbi:hypothetical protein MON38_03990 [Hymenobacter sp. DH14]|uniref:Uncharacterized protein n=1 Tax=Hymenobacter cyanobacteriorum TaxID=2926463 RepID=A0A9X1VHJ7_9BACT|nr:hypothetical protein [Hymenobacter cyanobacteriorum]MCI1186566.1 hypothetical protein [Hymenobacter cyanobacteriorum]